jgi:hypothetical protein
MSEIKNCPFCGKEPSLHRDTHDGSWRGFMLTCTNDDCDINPSTRLHRYYFKAIKSWNKRKPMTNPTILTLKRIE